MTDNTLLADALLSAPPPTTKRAKRTDDKGRAFAGSQMHLQVWVNRRQSAISDAILRALPIPARGARMRWVSPLENEKCREYKDGAFLRALGLSDDAPALSKFWPSGGPVWDGLAVLNRPTAEKDAIILVEAKSYPAEVLGGGCKAMLKSRLKIETALDETAAWLGVRRPATWTGALYQSANRIAHVYFLREQLGLEAYMVNVCFVGDPRMPTTEETWRQAKHAFRSDLGIADVAVPWLIDITLPAANREELVHPGE